MLGFVIYSSYFNSLVYSVSVQQHQQDLFKRICLSNIIPNILGINTGITIREWDLRLPGDFCFLLIGTLILKKLQSKTVTKLYIFQAKLHTRTCVTIFVLFDTNSPASLL